MLHHGEVYGRTDDPQPGIRVTVDDLPGTIIGMVIGNYDFKIRVILSKDALYALAQEVGFLIEYWDDDRNERV